VKIKTIVENDGDAEMLFRSIARCQVCNARLPLFSHLTFTHRVGVECRQCGSIMSHRIGFVLIQYIFTAFTVFLFIQTLYRREWLWWAIGSLVIFALLIGLLLTKELEIVYDSRASKHDNARAVFDS